jgi:hypothetical protein
LWASVGVVGVWGGCVSVGGGGGGGGTGM